MSTKYNKFVTILLILFLNIPSYAYKHPLHVSTTELSLNTKTKSVEISTRLFTDDFESILQKNFKQKIDLSNPRVKNDMEVLVKKYLLDHLNMQINSKTATLNFVGFEIDQEATYVYFEVEKISNIKSISINNSILYDQFDDQMSIIHVVNEKGQRKSGRILFPEKKFEAKF